MPLKKSKTIKKSRRKQTKICIYIEKSLELFNQPRFVNKKKTNYKKCIDFLSNIHLFFLIFKQKRQKQNTKNKRRNLNLSKKGSIVNPNASKKDPKDDKSILNAIPSFIFFFVTYLFAVRFSSSLMF